MDKFKPADPLLAVARIATVIVRIFLVIGMIGLGIGMVVVAAGGLGWLPDEVQVDFGTEMTGIAPWIAVAGILTALVVLGLIYDFVCRLAQVIATVGEGDPFIAANAERLTRMAWLALAVQLLSVATALLVGWTEHHVDPDIFKFESDVSLSGLGLSLVLFILARVFREGARMRAELEGTV